MKTYLLFLIILFSPMYINAQYRISMDDKSYESTKSLKFIQNGKTSFGVQNQENVTMGIGKKGQAGVLLLQKRNEEIFNQDHYIGGTLLITLENGEIIKCIDRNLRGYTDDTASAMYYLTQTEINKLQNFNISRISYSLWLKHFGKTNSKQFSARSTEETAYYVMNLFNP